MEYRYVPPNTTPVLTTKLAKRRADYEASKAKGRCNFCGRVGLHDDGDECTLLKCNGCKKVHYCGKDCQKQDWKVHKPACKAAAERAEYLSTLSPEEKAKAEFEESSEEKLNQTRMMMKYHYYPGSLATPVPMIHKDWNDFRRIQDSLLSGTVSGLLQMAGKDPLKNFAVLMSEYNPSNPNKAARFNVFDGFACTKWEAYEYDHSLDYTTPIFSGVRPGHFNAYLLNIVYKPDNTTQHFVYAVDFENETDETIERSKTLYDGLMDKRPDLKTNIIVRKMTHAGLVFNGNGFVRWEEGVEITPIEEVLRADTVEAGLSVGCTIA